MEAGICRRADYFGPTASARRDNSAMEELLGVEVIRASSPTAPQAGPGASRLGLRAARLTDVEMVAELRATVLQADLERLGRFDEHRVRQRLRDSFSVRHTSIITVEGDFAGSITMRPADDGYLLEHFYLAVEHQGRGIGSSVLRAMLDRADAGGMAVRLNVLRGSAAQRLYERHGFTLEHEDPIDIYMVRHAEGVRVSPHLPG